jgi:hypothetical protein
MRKSHVLVDHVSLEILNLMASLLQATRIADLRMGFAGGLPGDEIG